MTHLHNDVEEEAAANPGQKDLQELTSVLQQLKDKQSIGCLNAMDIKVREKLKNRVLDSKKFDQETIKKLM